MRNYTPAGFKTEPENPSSNANSNKPRQILQPLLSFL